MYLPSFVLCLSLGALVKCAAASEWCYTGCEHSPTHWTDIPGAFCGGNKQSPVDIVTSKVVRDSNLHNFTFVNFSNQHVIESIENNGHTVKLMLENNAVKVSGGGLNGTYVALQFHFHWGSSDHHPGSEHTVDGHRYPMEMHIVTLKEGATVEEAIGMPDGIAALGFFINATEDGDLTGPWSKLTSYLTNDTDTKVTFNHSISIDDLIGNVNRTKFYRYMGSLTTPNCNEAVVWTVFQEPIKVHKDLIKMFPTKTKLTDIYRPLQDLNCRHVYASHAADLPSSHSWCYSDHCEFSPSHWHLLPQSVCGGERQSPINIDTKKVKKDSHLNDFTFTKFEDKHTFDYIINTGHTVKCVLKDGMVEVSGGGLGHVYSTLQFHFHWGSTCHDSNGSEHTVDSKRYPMEMHIVNKRKDLTLDEALKTPNGLAVLGFFMESEYSSKSSGGGSGHGSETTNPSSSSSSDMEAWEKFTNYFSSIHSINSQVEVTEAISIDDLLGKASRTKYYRYNGSLTTPTCNEAVVWTVFKESVKVDKKLMAMFQTHAGYYNVYRPEQSLHSRTVFTSSASRARGAIILPLLLAYLTAFFV